MTREEKKDGYYWLIPDWFFNPDSETPNHINRIYRSALGQVWMKYYNKSYSELYSWYWYDDPYYIPTCPYCGNPLMVNKWHAGDNGHQFNIHKYYLNTCGSKECEDKWWYDWHHSEAQALHMDRLNDDSRRLDWIARSSRSKLINHHELGNFYIAFRVDGVYKFGVTSTDVGIRASAKAFGPCYTYYHCLLHDKMELVANLEYNIKSINNWSELTPTFSEFKLLFNKVYRSEKAFSYDPEVNKF